MTGAAGADVDFAKLQVVERLKHSSKWFPGFIWFHVGFLNSHRPPDKNWPFRHRAQMRRQELPRQALGVHHIADHRCE